MFKALTYYVAAVLLMLAVLLLWGLAQAEAVTLQWDAYTDPNGVQIQVYQRQATDCTDPHLFSKIATVPVTDRTQPGSYALPPLQPSTTPYCWYITATGPGGESGPSNVAIFQMSQPPASPSGLLVRQP